MFVGDDAGGVQRTRIGKVKDLTRKFEAILVGRSCNAEGGRYSLPVTKQPHRLCVICPFCGEQVYYLQIRKEQTEQARAK